MVAPSGCDVAGMVSLVWGILILLSPLVIAVVPPENADPPEVCNTRQLQCGTGSCVPLSWQCDGEKDCPDGTDEKNCDPAALSTCKPKEFRCGTGMCIPVMWQCDGELDCPEGLDEWPELCGSPRCGDGFFQCVDGGRCIPESWVCDDHDDCKDASDEKSCNVTCTDSEFLCGGECIQKRWLCDGEPDCRDGEDELNCEKTECDATEEIVCSDGACISKRWRCDGQADCSDGADEEGCVTNLNKTRGECRQDEFRCLTQSQCIHLTWRCDGDLDCQDGSDESEALCGTQTKCRSDQFLCGSGECIPAHLRCSGQTECLDWSDEDNCTHVKTVDVQCNQRTEFPCGNGKCVPVERVCDTINDCGNFADEPKDLCGGVKSCSVDNGGCLQQCVESDLGPYCSCFPGYYMDANHTCQDIDECSRVGACSQYCENTVGGFSCSCLSGYREDSQDPTRCKAEAGRLALMFAHKTDIRVSDLRRHETIAIVEDTRSAAGLDYHYEAGQVFWSDGVEGRIYRAKISDNTATRRVVVDQGAGEGIAVDWIHDTLYWVRSRGTDRMSIAVTDFDGRVVVDVVSDNLDKPRSIAVHPKKGWIFWSDWGNQPRIEKAGMDGSGREVLVGEGIRWPNGLCLDLVLEQLYWVDAKMHTLNSVSIFGGENRVVIKSQEHLYHPFSVAVFEDWVYWTEWGENSSAIYRANKFTGDMISPLKQSHLQVPMTIKVYHKYTQPPGENFCRGRLDTCSHLCVPAPQHVHTLLPAKTSNTSNTSSTVDNYQSGGRRELGRAVTSGEDDRSRELSRCLCPADMTLTTALTSTCVKIGGKEETKEMSRLQMKMMQKDEPWQEKDDPHVNSRITYTLDSNVFYGVIIGAACSAIVVFGMIVASCYQNVQRRLGREGAAATPHQYKYQAPTGYSRSIIRQGAHPEDGLQPEEGDMLPETPEVRVRPGNRRDIVGGLVFHESESMTPLQRPSPEDEELEPV